MNTIDYEKHIVTVMMRLYCRKHKSHRARAKEGGTPGGLCPDCVQLLDYAYKRLDHCRYGADKPSCRKCPIHCYKADMREQMRIIMRWAGPRMILYHPVDAVKHMIREMR